MFKLFSKNFVFKWLNIRKKRKTFIAYTYIRKNYFYLNLDKEIIIFIYNNKIWFQYSCKSDLEGLL